jgi:hypothetical protein
LPIKSDADKVEKYLIKCSLDPILKSSTLLRDFLSPQREGDLKESLSTVSSHDPLPIAITPTTTTVPERDQVKLWEPGLNPSIIESLNRESLKEEVNPLDDLEMVKVLGKGCMGKVKYEWDEA